MSGLLQRQRSGRTSGRRLVSMSGAGACDMLLLRPSSGWDSEQPSSCPSDIPKVRKIRASFSVTEEEGTAGAELRRSLRPPQNEAADEQRAEGAVASTSLSN